MYIYNDAKFSVNFLYLYVYVYICDHRSLVLLVLYIPKIFTDTFSALFCIPVEVLFIRVHIALCACQLTGLTFLFLFFFLLWFLLLLFFFC